jgi:hypothetical protein
VDDCPAEAAVGIASVTVRESPAGGGTRSPGTEALPLFNLVPGRGEPARFGFFTFGIPVVLNTSVRTGEDYGVTVRVENIEEELGLLESQVTFWGVPEDPRHDASRGYECLDSGFFDEEESCHPPADRQLRPLLTLPTSCPNSLTATMEADPWADPADLVTAPYALQNDAGSALGLEGCDRLPFSPSISVEPEAHSASSPAGLSVGVHLPQEADETPSGVSESDLEDTTVTLPQGVTLNPSAASGLVGCSTEQIALESPGAGSCPEASKVGTVKIKTPLLPNELEGSVYVASPQNFATGPSENPFRSLVALYVVAEDPVSGVVVKLAGKVSPNETTGQLATTFENTPQLPFEELKLSFFGGARAALSTPSSCGTYTSEASFTPYSGTAPVQSSSRLEINSGVEGAGCPASRPFAPSFVAGTTGTQAGAFSPFTLTFARRDQDQSFGTITVQTSPGLLGDLASVPLCGEAQANAGTCSSASEIGDTTTEAGVGSEPVTLPQAGQPADPVYLTGPYGGQPFGLSIVVPAVAGPFNLGTVVVRASIAVNPTTSALTITSSPLPTMLQGIPLDIKTVNVTVNRPGFMFNPTTCSPQTIGATITSSGSTAAAVSSPFEAVNCPTLPFKPSFSASTEAHAEALKDGSGAALNVKIASKGGPGVSGEEANIKRVDVTVPKLLPARLQPTLQNACTEAQFAKDAADCPPDSFVGTATAVTPVLDAPLTGPAIFVSHGGAAFPDLDLVLQGEGVEILLTGYTDIKGGVTYSKFETVPDAPISSFDLSLPEGPHSALASGLPTNDKSLCGQSLEMPTMIEGQNGAVFKQTTKVTIEGCKPALYVRSTKVSGKSVTITVTVPSAGKIVASGSGLSRQTKQSAAEKLVTLKLALSRAQAAKVSKTHKLKTKIKLAFTPKKGRKLTKTVMVTFK